jgi:hypothetical protein
MNFLFDDQIEEKNLGFSEFSLSVALKSTANQRLHLKIYPQDGFVL